MQPRRFGPAFSHHHQDLTPPKSPLTTRHMHSPGAHHHHWVSGDTSSGSAEEKQHKAPPQKKPPMLPPKHAHGTHGHKYLPQVSNDSEHNSMLSDSGKYMSILFCVQELFNTFLYLLLHNIAIVRLHCIPVPDTLMSHRQ